MAEDVYVGLPTLSLFPMRSCRFKVVKQIEIEIPLTGNYHEMSPELFPEESGEFDFSEDFIYLPAVTKVLLATGKYPILRENQIFTPLGLDIGEDKVLIPGSILEIISIES